MKAKIFTFFIIVAMSGVAQAQLVVLKTPAPPVIDGIIDEADPWGGIEEWQDQLALSADATGASSRFKMLHDDNSIYVAVEVLDDTPNNAHETNYQNDCVELFYHMSDDNESVTTYGASTSQLRFQRVEEVHGFTGGDAGVLSAAFEEHAGFNYESVSDESGYVVEAMIPIEVLDGGGSFNDTDFFFEIGTADNTGDEVVLYLFWKDNSDNQWQDVSTFSPVELSQEEVPTAVESVAAEIAYVHVANDMLNFRNVEGDVNIYSISGALVKKDVIERNGSIDISALNSGIYVVKADKLSAKIIK